jgi:hypothetical protein
MGSGVARATGPCPPGTAGFQATQFGYEPYVDQFDEITMTVRLPVPFATAPTEIPLGGSMHFTGWNAYPTASIHAEVTDPAGTGLECDTGPIAAFGSWTCAIHTDEEIPPGTTATVTFTQSMAGIADETGTLEVYIGQAPPAQVRLDAPGDEDWFVYDAGNFLALNGAAPLAGGFPVSVDIDGTPLCTDAPVDVDGIWDCGNVSVPWEGADTFGPRTITATQGMTTDSATIDLYVPGPDDDSPYFADEGDTALWVGGDGIEGFTIFAQVRDHPEISCSTTPWYAGFWDCQLDVSSLPVGTYVVDSHQRPVPDPGDSVQSVISEAVLYIEEPPPPPTIECAFSPGGIRAWSNDPSVGIDLYATYSIGGDEGYTPSQYGACSGLPGNVPQEDLSYELLQSCDPECVLTGLAPGVYNLYYGGIGEGDGEGEGEGSTWYDYFFTIPEAPTITSVTAPSGQVVMRGTGTPGDDLRVDAVGAGTLCSTSVNGAGEWVCSFPVSSASAARAVDIDAVSRGMSAYSASVALPVAPAPPAAPPLPTLLVISWLLDFGGGLDGLLPGDVFTVTSSGLPAGTSIEIWMNSTPVLLKTAVATGGTMAFTLMVPLDIEPGEHTVELIATAPDGTVLSQVAPATVNPIPAKAAPGTEEVADHFGYVKNPPGWSGDRSDPAGATALSDSIPTAQRIAENPIAVAVAAGLAIALLFLVALPTELLNASLSSNSTRLGRGFRAVEGGMNRARDWLVQVTRSRAIAAAITVLLVSITFGFIDPAFGFDLASVRLVLSLAIAFFILSYGASWVSGLIVRRAWGAESVVALQPSIILFAVVGVVVARLLDFSPGVLIGVAIGLELIRASRKAALGAVLVQFGMVVGLALAAWVVYSILALGAPPADFGSALVRDTLVAITAEGLMGALVAVFPLRFLDGREIFEASKWLWGLCFVVVAGAFALLVLPTALAGTDVGDVGVWLLVFLGFGAISVAVWWVLARADKRAAAAEQERERVDA